MTAVTRIAREAPGKALPRRRRLRHVPFFLDAGGQIEEKEREHRFVLLQGQAAGGWVSGAAVAGARAGLRDVGVDVNALSALLVRGRTHRQVDGEDARSRAAVAVRADHRSRVRPDLRLARGE